MQHSTLADSVSISIRPFNITTNDTVEDQPFVTLRPWQNEAFALTAAQRLIKIDVPTGAGKSVLMKTLALYWESLGYRVIIALPKRDIGSSFNNESVDVPGMGITDFHIYNRNNLIHGDDIVGEPLYQRFATFCRAKRGGKTLLCTHATLVNVYDQILQHEDESLLDDVVLLVDEAHHITQHVDETTEEGEIVNGIGRVVKHFIQHAKTRLALVTATWFRGDRLSILPPATDALFTRYCLPISDSLQSCKYLRNIKISVHVTKEHPLSIIRQTYDPVSDRAIVYIPNINTNYYNFHNTTKYEEAAKIMSCIGDYEKIVSKDGVFYKSKSAVAINLVDDNPSHRRGSSGFLSTHANNRLTAPELIIALDMCKEGTNIPYANKCYILGYRKSVTELIQMIGRLLRDVEGKDTIEIVLIILDDVDAQSIEYSINTYFNCVFLTMMTEDTLNPPAFIKHFTPEQLALYRIALEKVVSSLPGAPEDVSYDFVANIVSSIGGDTELAKAVFIRLLGKFSKGGSKVKKLLNINSGFKLQSVDISLLREHYLYPGVRSFVSDKISFDNMFGQYRKKLNSYLEADYRRIDKIVAFISKNGKTPNPANLATLGIGRNYLTIKRKDRDCGKLNPKLEQYAASVGHPFLFCKYSARLDTVDMLCKLSEDGETLPASVERSVQQNLSAYCRYRADGTSWNDECENIVMSHGCDKLFSVKRVQGGKNKPSPVRLQQIRELCAVYKKHGKIPKNHKLYYTFLQLKHNITHNKTWYPEYDDEIIIHSGHELFNMDVEVTV